MRRQNPLLKLLLFANLTWNAAAYGESRRTFMKKAAGQSALISSGYFGLPVSAAYADEAANDFPSSTVLKSEITDKIFVDFKGLQPQDESSYGQETDKIVIGLFGKDEPNCVNILLQLVSDNGFPAKCKPRAERLLEREQLEANKVYKNCLASEDVGVDYDLSSVWRIIKDERIEVGAVSGKFIARENPTFESSSPGQLRHDMPGVVSVRKGSDGGFGFTICPSGGKHPILDEDNIVVGRVIEGMNVIEKLNNAPVVTSAKGLNYMALTGGPTVTDAPNRSCRYGGPLYCNENKPLRKLLVAKTELFSILQ